MNVIARLEYELAYYDSAVHRFNHYTTRTPPKYGQVVDVAGDSQRCGCICCEGMSMWPGASLSSVVTRWLEWYRCLLLGDADAGAAGWSRGWSAGAAALLQGWLAAALSSRVSWYLQRSVVRRPDMPGGSKNATGPVGIPLKKGASDARGVLVSVCMT